MQDVAIVFLLDHGFKFDSITYGVPYLSRQEEAYVRLQAQEREQRKKNIEDIQLRGEDTQALEFVKRVRKQIKLWTSKKPVSPFALGESLVLRTVLASSAPNISTSPRSTSKLGLRVLRG